MAERQNRAPACIQEWNAVMPDDRPSPAEQLAQQIEATRGIIRKSIQILRENPKPSTFLGQSTRGPLPLDGEKVDG